MEQVLNVTDTLDDRGVSLFQIKVAALCALVIGFDGFDAQALAFVAPALGREWGFARGALGEVFGAALFGMLIGALLLGTLADYFGRKRMLLLATLIFGLGALATLLANDLSDLMLIRFLTGVGLGGVLPNAVALTGEYSPRKHRAMMIMVMFSAVTIGSALGGVLAAKLIPSFGWKAVFLVGGLLPLIFLPLLWGALPESLHVLIAQGNQSRVAAIWKKIDPAFSGASDIRFIVHEEEKPRGLTLPHLFREKRGIVTLLFWTIFFMNLLDIYFLNSWLPTLISVTGLGDQTAILITVMFQLGGTLGSFLLSWLITRLGFFAVLGTNFLAGFAAILALGWAGAETAILIPAAFIAGACVIGGQGGCNAMVSSFYPAFMRSTGVGWALGIGRVGSIVGPVLGGWMLLAHWDVAKVFTAGAAPQFCAALVIIAIGAVTGWRLHRKEG